MFPEMPERGDVPDETIEDLMATSLKMAEVRIEDLKQSHHESLHRQIIEECIEEHEERAAGIRLWAFQERTGHPF
ncbi:MAG: hypothetical protein ACKVHE_12145 [Planctomycetales bacterium]|jgi:hypothetical protein